MTQATRNGIANNIAEARKWLGRKWRNINMRKTHPVLKELLNSCNEEQSQSPKNMSKQLGKSSSSSSSKSPKLAEAKEKPFIGEKQNKKSNGRDSRSACRGMDTQQKNILSVSSSGARCDSKSKCKAEFPACKGCQQRQNKSFPACKGCQQQSQQ